MHTWLAMRCGRDGYAIWSAAGPGTGDATLVYLADLETAAAFVAAFGLELTGGCAGAQDVPETDHGPGSSEHVRQPAGS